MKIDAWYNWRFWWWDITSWLCHFNIRQCKSCYQSRLYDGYSNRWPLWWRIWTWFRDQIVGDDPDPQYSELDHEDGLK